jgi:O-methyltransferase
MANYWSSIAKFIHDTPLLHALRTWVAKKIRKSRIAFTFYFDYRKDIYDKLLTILESDIWGGGSMSEAYNLYALTKNTNKLEGDIAEVGVWKGGQSTIIAEAKGDKNLHLFDSFEGFDENECKNKNELEELKKEQLYSFKIDVEKVREHFSKYPNVFIYKGWFPKTAKPVKNKKFCFVNLDVNLYKSQMDCLKFFYPRMVQGGIIIIHDYTILPEIRKSFDEFFKDKPEPVIELSGSHAMIVKV